MLIAGAMLSACGDDTHVSDDDTSAGDTATRPDTPTPWIFEDDADEVAPSLSPETLQAALEAALDASMQLQPREVKDLHDLIFPPPEDGSGDPSGCPFFLTYDYGTAKAFYWQGECTTSDGRMFSGYGYAQYYQGQPVDFGTIDGYTYYLAGRLEAADGTWLEGAGSVTEYSGGGPQLDGFSRAMDGTFAAGGPRAPTSSWLDGTRRPAMSVSGWLYPPTGGKNLMFTGGIGGLSDFPGGVTAVSLDDLTVRTLLAGSACGNEFGGSASVRGPDGSWYDIVFDGPTDDDPDSTPAALCDGCGDTFFRGAAVTATCISPAPYVAWQTRPW